MANLTIKQFRFMIEEKGPENFVGMDLSGLDFPNFDLSGLTFSGCDFHYTAMHNVKF